jgi:hypothetical protein
MASVVDAKADKTEITHILHSLTSKADRNDIEVTTYHHPLHINKYLTFTSTIYF